jgi:hypothetical protein
MLDHNRNDSSEHTLDHVPLADIAESRHCSHNVVSAEMQALLILERGPLKEWDLERKIMDHGFSAWVAYRAVRMAIADNVIERDGRSKECRLAKHAPRGIKAKFLAWLVSVFG